MTRRRLADALRSTGDLAAWPLGVLGFLVRGGIVVLALPILTLPSPVGLATSLGPAVISTGRLDGPLRGLLLGWGLFGLVVLAGALVASASVERAVHARSHAGVGRPVVARPTTAAERRVVGRLLVAELIALLPLVIVVLVAGMAIVDAVRTELLLPGDLTVPLPIRVLGQSLVPIAALVVAVLAVEALDGSLTRRVLVPGRRRPPLRSVVRVVGTAATGWVLTSAVLVPGVVLLAMLWQATRLVWGRPLAPSPSTITDVGAIVAAVASVVLLVAVWLSVLLLCGLASLARAALWTSRVADPDPWISGAGRASDT